jgi:hypothetical protein
MCPPDTPAVQYTSTKIVPPNAHATPCTPAAAHLDGDRLTPMTVSTVT